MKSVDFEEVDGQEVPTNCAAVLASADLLLNPESLLELVGCSKTSDSAGLAEAEGFADGESIFGTGNAERRRHGQLDSNSEPTVGGRPPESAQQGEAGDSCRGGAALAVQLIEKLLTSTLYETKAAMPAQGARCRVEGQERDGGAEEGNREGDGGQTEVEKEGDGEPEEGGGTNKGSLLTSGQLAELLCLHLLLSKATVISGPVGCKDPGPIGALAEYLTSQLKQSSNCIGLQALLQMLDLIDPSLANSANRVKQSGAGDAATTYLLVKANHLLKQAMQVPEELQVTEGVSLQSVGAIVHKAVQLFKRTCSSTFELAGLSHKEPNADGAQEEGLRIEDDMPAVAALARALGVDAALPSFGLPFQKTAQQKESDKARKEGAAPKKGAESSLQLAALTVLSAAFDWFAKAYEGGAFQDDQAQKVVINSNVPLEGQASPETSGHAQKQYQSQDLRGDPKELVRIACKPLVDSGLSFTPNYPSTLNGHSLIDGLLSTAESAAVLQVAQGLLGWEDLVLEEGYHNPAGQLLVYVAVLFWMELEAGLKEPLVSAYCGLLSSLAKFHTSPHPLLDLATGVVRGLLATFDFQAGTALQSLAEVILKLSPLESSVAWAVDAIEDCLKDSSGDDGATLEGAMFKGVERKRDAFEAAKHLRGDEKSAAIETSGEASWEAVDLLRSGGVSGEGVLYEKHESCGSEEAGIETDVPVLEESCEELTRKAIKTESLEGRRQLLGVLVDFLVGALTGSERPSSGGKEDTCRETQVAPREEDHVDMGLDLLMQNIAAFSCLCNWWADCSRSLERRDDEGLLDEQRISGVLEGVSLSLKPVIEAVVWLCELCEDALLDVAERTAAPKSAAGMGNGLRKQLEMGEDGQPEAEEATRRERGGAKEEGAQQLDKGEFEHVDEGSFEQLEKGGFEQLEKGRFKQLEEGGFKQLAEGESKQLEEGESKQLEEGESKQLEEGEFAQLDKGEFEQQAEADLEMEEVGQLEGRNLLEPDVEQLEAAVQLAQLGVAMGSAVQRVAERKHLGVMEGLCTSLARLQNHWSHLLSAYQACKRKGLHSSALLTALAVLCEESAELRNSGAGFWGLGIQKDPSLFDGETSKEERSSSADLSGEAGTVLQKQDAESQEVGKARTRSGREKKAPSDWWAVVDQNARTKKRKSGTETAARKGKSPKVGPSKGDESVEKPLVGGSSKAEATHFKASEEAAEIDLEEEEKRYDKRSKKQRQMLTAKRRKAQARASSQNKFVAYAIEEQMLDSDPEWDSDEYSDMEDFIVLENEEVDFKTMPLAAITPYVPYEIEARAQAPVSGALTTA